MDRRCIPRFTLFLVSILVAVALPLCALFGFTLDDAQLCLHAVDGLDAGWTLIEEGKERPLARTDRGLGRTEGSFVLQNTLPKICNHDMALLFHTNGESAVVSIDGEVVWTFGDNDDMWFGLHTGPVWCLVPLQESAAGQEISIEFTARGGRLSSDGYIFRLDNKNALILTFIYEHFFVLCNSLIGIIVGAVLMVDALYRLRRRSSLVGARLCLGLTTLLSGVWAFCYSGLMQLLCGNAAFAYLLNNGAFFLIGMPSTMLHAYLQPKHDKLFHRLSLAFPVLFLVSAALYVTGVAEISNSIIVVHALMIACALCIIVTCLRNRSRRASRLMLAGMFCFSVIGMLALAEFYLMPTMPFPSPADLTLVGMDVMLIFFYVALMQSNVRAGADATQYARQAHTDALTGAASRAALEERLSLPEARNPLTVFMVDLNNLKIVNDTLGHEAGDTLLRDLVQCLRSAFGASGAIFRYGGDEFVILTDNATRESAQDMEKHLDDVIDAFNRTGGCEIDVAVGFAVRGEGSSVSARELLRIADANMYEIKQRKKAGGTLPRVAERFLLDSVDPLTGLLVFDAFRRRVHARLSEPGRPPLAIISFDLNHFDGYNSLFGWAAGDSLLKSVADVAVALCGPHGFCAHGEADSFWVLVDFTDPEAVFSRIRDENARFIRQNDEIHLFMSFGLYIIDEPGIPVREMCNRARIAKRTVKGRFDRLYAIYSPDQHIRQITKLRMSGYMHSGLRKDEFRACFQPVCASDTREIVAMEALVRWHHADGTVTPPGEFIDLFEKNGLLLNLDVAMFEQVCREQRHRLDRQLPAVPISVNLSRMHAYTPGGADVFRRILDDFRIPVELVRIELTETAFVTDEQRLTGFVRDLQRHGFIILIDDFGSGLSSLGLLGHLPIDGLKLDRSFLAAPSDDSITPLILESIISICHKTNLIVIAEGVETEAQLAFLRSLNCPYVQGTLLGPASAAGCARTH